MQRIKKIKRVLNLNCTKVAPAFNEVLHVPKKLDSSMDESLSQMLYKMLITSQDQAETFSEIGRLIAL